MSLILLGGFTGSGKTLVLQQLLSRSQQVLDLEKLASHNGSVFGNTSPSKIVTPYIFNKAINKTWRSFNETKPVYTEIKSPQIGHLNIPVWLFKKMELAPVIWLDTHPNIRIKHLLAEYGQMDALAFINALYRLNNKMDASLLDKISCDYVSSQKEAAFATLINYYDRGIYYQQKRYKIIIKVKIADWNVEDIADRIVRQTENFFDSLQ